MHHLWTGEFGLYRTRGTYRVAVACVQPLPRQSVNEFVAIKMLLLPQIANHKG